MWPTVRVMLRGGLGNQLFGWATGFSLAKRVGGRLVLNLYRIKHGDYDQLDPRKFELGILDALTEENEHRSYLGLHYPTGLSRMGIYRFRCQFFRETGFQYDPGILQIRGSACLDGYFQSWKYFDQDKAEIRRRLNRTFLGPAVNPSTVDVKFDRPWIAVHVRCGDYMRIDNMERLDSDYYRLGIQELRSELGQVDVVGFSDDVDVARSIAPDVDHWVDDNAVPKADATMALMANAIGFVGANSTFSWWAAYLSSRPDGLNVFPRKWFRSSDIVEADLFPDGWKVR